MCLLLVSGVGIWSSNHHEIQIVCCCRVAPVHKIYTWCVFMSHQSIGFANVWVYFLSGRRSPKSCFIHILSDLTPKSIKRSVKAAFVKWMTFDHNQLVHISLRKELCCHIMSIFSDDEQLCNLSICWRAETNTRSSLFLGNWSSSTQKMSNTLVQLLKWEIPAVLRRQWELTDYLWAGRNQTSLSALRNYICHHFLAL